MSDLHYGMAPDGSVCVGRDGGPKSRFTREEAVQLQAGLSQLEAVRMAMQRTYTIPVRDRSGSVAWPDLRGAGPAAAVRMCWSRGGD